METNTKKSCSGFTLAEAMATLVIAAMIMVAAGLMYNRIRNSEVAINLRLDQGGLGREVLQRIAEDIDRMALPSSDVKMTIKHRTEEGGYQSSQMTIESSFYDKDNKKDVFEKIVWQSKAVDESMMIIYRAHSGYTVEDKMLDEVKEQFEREMFIPVCRNVSLFLIEAASADAPDVFGKWKKEELPSGVRISLSFAEPIENVLGDMEVPVEEIKTRTIAVDRTRQMIYKFMAIELPDINDVGDYNDMDNFGTTDANSMVKDVNDNIDEEGN